MIPQKLCVSNLFVHVPQLTTVLLSLQLVYLNDRHFAQAFCLRVITDVSTRSTLWKLKLVATALNLHKKKLQ